MTKKNKPAADQVSAQIQPLRVAYDPARHLRTEADREAYLAAARETGDPGLLAWAERAVARSRGEQT